MKNLIFKSSFHEKLKMLIIPMMLLTLGVGQMWGAELKNGQYIYIHYSTSTWATASAKFRFNWYWNVGDYCCWNNESGRVDGENYAYAQTQNAYTRAVQILRFNSTYSAQWNYTNTVAVTSNTNNCITLTASISDNYTFSWSTYAPPMSTVTLADNGTSIVSGSGTSGDPYLVYVSTPIKVSASGTKAVADPDATINYDFKQGSTSKQDGTGTTYQFDASSTPNTTYTINLDGYTKVGSTNSTKNAATALYYKTIAPTEPTHDVTLSYKCGSTSIKDGTTESAVGESTSRSITAPSITGYTFSSWTKGAGVNITSGTTSSSTISITTNSSGAYTLTANYTEDLTTSWYIAGATGTNYPFTGWGTSGISMSKKTGHSTEEIYYCDVVVNRVATGNEYEFQTYNSANSTYYGYNNKDITKESNSTTVYSGNPNNMHFKPYLTGTYEFKLDNTGANPVLTVTWPVYNQVRISAASPTADAANVGNFDLGAAVSNVRSVTRSLKANDTYTFKVVSNSEWYGYNSGAFTRSTSTSSNSLTTSTSGGDMTLTTDYAGDYTFKFNESTKALSVDFPEAYKVTYGKGSVNGSSSDCSAVDIDNSNASITSNSTWVKSGHRVKLTAPSAKSGYTYDGWFDNNSGTGEAITTAANCTITVASALTRYACYHENDYTVTVAAGAGGSVASTSVIGHKDTKVTLPTATANPGYYFTGWEVTSGTATLTSSSSATAAQINGMTDAVTVRANFAPIWRIACSSDSYNTESHQITTITTSAGAMTSGSVTIDLDANTDYEFKVYNKSTDKWWGHSGTVTKITYTNKGTAQSLSEATGNNQTFRTAGKGTYTFTWNVSNSKISIGYPTSYTVTFGYGTGGSAVTASVESSGAITSGQYAAAGKDITFTQTPATGYELKGWYTASSGGTAVSGMSTSDNVLDDIAANANVYAQYNPKNYIITLDVDEANKGTITGATTSHSVTYNTAVANIPNLPTAANGYGLDGYYTGQNGAGTKLFNSDGSCIASVSGYTDANKKWIRDDNSVKLYAYYKKAEITGFTGGGNVDHNASVTITPTIDPIPVGDRYVCWRLLYGTGDPVASQPEFTWNGTSVTFNAPDASGNYKVEAKLRSGTNCEGTLLDTKTVDLIVAGSYNVTIQYKHDDVTIKTQTVKTVHSTTPTEITAPTIVGYSFSSWTLGTGITLASGALTDPTISVTAIYAGTITANYTPKRMIYFYNTLGWSSVTVYFYKNDKYWGYGDDEGKGTGSNPDWVKDGVKPFAQSGLMTQITGTNIWYYDCEANSVNSSYSNVAFTEYKQDNYNYFSYKYGTTTPNKVARRGDYKSTLPMFVPIEQDGVSMNGGQAYYYSDGYWMNYPENSGYTLKIYSSWDASSASREYVFPYSDDLKMPLKLDVEFNFTGKTWFQIYRNDAIYLGANASMTQESHSNYRLDVNSNQKIELKTSSPGIYTYTLTYYDDEEKKGDGTPYGVMYHISVDYPVSEGDYRIVYKDDDTWSNGAHGDDYATWYHPSNVINKISAEATIAKKDTVSFFVSYGKSPAMKFQYVSAIDAGTGAITWTDVASGTITIPSSVNKKGVYNFIVTQPVGGSSISLEKAEPYTGEYYIRTDCAGTTKWDNYHQSDHHMTYSSYAEANSSDNYSHYFVKFVGVNTNVKFTIANDYSVAITDSLIADATSKGPVIDGGGKMTAPATGTNIRFMWDQRTNKLSRAYITGPISNEYLYLRCLTENANVYRTWTSPSSYSRLTSVSKSEKSTSYAVDTLVFNDMQNWIYQADLYVKPGATYKLTANVNGTMTFFRGKEGNYTSTNVDELMGGSGTTAYHIRLIYDFKNDRMVTAWMPSGQIDENLDINADVMIIRNHQEAAQQITFASNKSMSDVKTVYGAIQFNRWTLDNRSTTGTHEPLPSGSQKSIFERSLYFISFPFDVKVNEIFGFGKYWDEWYLEYYDGLTRAKNGYWADSPSNWKYVTTEMAKTYTLEANKGYILGLDLDFMQSDNTDFWSHGIESVALYFPSSSPVGNIQATTAQQPALSDDYYCSINRGTPDGDRRVKDSYWRCIGVPSYANYEIALQDGSSQTITWTTGSTLPYLYEWRMQDNTLQAQSTSAYHFKAMHSYLVQYAGVINWTAVSAKPSSVARRDIFGDTEYNWCITLEHNDQVEDQTFIRLRDDEMVTAGFDFDQDLSKEFNAKRSDIYTFIGYEKAAANSMPINTESALVIPVGLNIEAAGDYTIAIPEGTNGVEVKLLDSETGLRTNLSAGLDYTVTLSAGDYTDRFFIEIAPIKQDTPIETSIGETVSGNKDPIRKVFINGLLYIVKDGKVFDARGARIQ